MTAKPPNSITGLLAAAHEGDATAHERLRELVHSELHSIAGRQMAAITASVRLPQLAPHAGAGQKRGDDSPTTPIRFRRAARA